MNWMDKIYQVFVSSTYTDLQEERKEVMQALLELDCMPSGMELFPASNEDQWSLIKRVIDNCDYYILIIGGRYGSENSEGISYTQMEFQYALDTGKPIISFLHKHPESIPSGKCENDIVKLEKLDRFRDLAKKKLVKFWDTPEELGSAVSRSMVKLIRDFPAEGWVKAGSITNNQSLKELVRLQKENSELLQQLHKISTEAPKGTEDYAQGEDVVKIYYTFSAYRIGGYEQERFNCEYEEIFSWNEIFSAVAPAMIDGCSESMLEYRLNDFIGENNNWNEDERFNGLGDAGSYFIKQESFDQIKIQLRALGYIALSDKERIATDQKTYWKLTPYGDYVMTRLLAIKRR